MGGRFSRRVRRDGDGFDLRDCAGVGLRDRIGVRAGAIGGRIAVGGWCGGGVATGSGFDLLVVGGMVGLEVVVFKTEVAAIDIAFASKVARDPGEQDVDGPTLLLFLLFAQQFVFGGHVAFPVDMGREFGIVGDDVGAIGGRFRFDAHGGHGTAKRADDEGGVMMTDLRAQDALDDVVESELERGRIFDVRERRVEFGGADDGAPDDVMAVAERATAEGGEIALHAVGFEVLTAANFGLVESWFHDDFFDPEKANTRVSARSEARERKQRSWTIEKESKEVNCNF